MKIEVYAISDFSVPARISSARAYDAALSLVFPYFTYLSYGSGSDLASELADGRSDGFRDAFPSFALSTDFGTDGRVLWLSESALKMLEDLHEIEMKQVDINVPA